jgi:hypothetical protein
MRTMLPAAVVVLGMSAAGALLTGASTSGAYAIPGYKTYRATLDVAGSFVATKHTDTTARCSPGQEITLDLEAGVEMGRPRPVEVQVSPYHGSTTEATSTHDGEARHVGTVVGYRETNYCDSPPAELVKPECSRNVGRLHATVVGTSAKAGAAVPLSLVLRRDGGGTFDGTNCELPYVSTKVKGAELSLLASGQSGIVLPLGITNKTLLGLGRGRSLAREITFRGPCDDVKLAIGRARTRVILPGTPPCVVKGSIWMKLKRAR